MKVLWICIGGSGSRKTSWQMFLYHGYTKSVYSIFNLCRDSAQYTWIIIAVVLGQSTPRVRRRGWTLWEKRRRESRTKGACLGTFVRSKNNSRAEHELLAWGHSFANGSFFSMLERCNARTLRGVMDRQCAYVCNAYSEAEGDLARQVLLPIW